MLSKGANGSGSLTEVVLHSQYIIILQWCRIRQTGTDDANVSKETGIELNLDQTSTVASKNQLLSIELPGWHPQFFIATSSSPDIRRVSFPLYFTMAQGEDASSVVTTLSDAGKY